MRNFTRTAAEYYSSARHRAQRRKSAWNVALIACCFGGWLGVWYALFRLVWLFHATLYPEHRLADFWQAGIGFGRIVPSFLMMFSLMPGAAVIGFMLGNVLFRLIPPARRAFDAEARGCPGVSFQESMRDLRKVLVWVLPIGLAMSFAAAYLLDSLR